MGVSHPRARQPVARTFGEPDRKHLLHSTNTQRRAALNRRDGPTTSRHRTTETDIRAEWLGRTTNATVRR